MPKFHLVLLIHSHQPVGNFDGVFEQTYQRSYLPFVQHLVRHPKVRLGLHYTGPLLEWFELRHPEFLDTTLRELVARGQVEMVGGGFYEPILISIPPEDQAEQLGRMSDYIQQKFGAAPAGAWLAERVWEPQLPYALSLSNIQYTLVDDVHFAAAGFEADQLHGDYVCEERGRTVRVFPGLKTLRYLLPFRSVEEAIGYLRESAEAHPGGMASMGDDCEKFGAWPNTYDHCYAEGTGWVEHFFTALEAVSGDWLLTTPPVVNGFASAPAAWPRRPAHGFLFRNDGMGAADRRPQGISHRQRRVCLSSQRLEIPARGPLARLLHQVRGVELAAPEDAACLQAAPRPGVRPIGQASTGQAGGRTHPLAPRAMQ